MKLLETVLLSNLLVALLAMSGCRGGETTAEVKRIATKAPVPRLIKQLTQVGLNGEQLVLVRGWVAKARGEAYGRDNDFQPEVDIRTIMKEIGFAGRVDIIEILAEANTLGAKEFVSTATEQAALAGNGEAVDLLLTLYEADIDLDKVLLAAARGDHLPLVERMSVIKSDPDDDVWDLLAEEAGFNDSTSMLDLVKEKGDNSYGSLNGHAVDGAIKGGNLDIVEREFPGIDSSTYPNNDPAVYYMHMTAEYGYPNIIEYLSHQSGDDIPLEMAEVAAREGHTNVLEFMEEAGVFNLNENDEKNYKTVARTLLRLLVSAASRGHSTTVDYMINLIMSRTIFMEKAFPVIKEEAQGDRLAGDTTGFAIVDDVIVDDKTIDEVTNFIKSLTFDIETVLTIVIRGAAQGDHTQIVDDMIGRLSNGIQADRASELSKLPSYIEKALLEAAQHGSNNTVRHILHNYAVQDPGAEIFQEVRELAVTAARWGVVNIVDKNTETIENWINRIKNLIKLRSPVVVVLDQVSTIVARGYQLSTQDANLILNYAAKNGSIELLDHAIKLGAKDFDGALRQAEAAGNVDIVTRLEQAKAAALAEELKNLKDTPKI